MKNILLVIDYQNDFVDGALGFSQAAELETAIVAKIEHYKRNGDPVAFTFDTHQPDYLATQEGKKLPVLHCLQYTPGWQLYGQVASLCSAGDLRFEKGAFGSMELVAYLRGQGFERVELVGVVSHICVLANAVLAKAALPEAEIVIDAACTASFDERLHQAALDVMAGLQMTVVNR
ncbi:cysteine hydrolase family protein [Sporomusa termitida]|uniref:cysteine hydrolase family protein n=1 Tax=Sporomusa termitida TaxID=2377 RepID=UPI001186CEF6|nr:isochorismatase family cysteine hydrolase [Sporomusa termitida]